MSKKMTAAEYRIKFARDAGGLFSFLKMLPPSIVDTHEKEGLSAKDGRYIKSRKACVCPDGLASFIRSLPQGNEREMMVGASQAIRAAIGVMTSTRPTLFTLSWSANTRVKVEASALQSFAPGMAQPREKAAARTISFVVSAEAAAAAAAKAAAAMTEAAEAAAAKEAARAASVTAREAKEAAEAAALSLRASAEAAAAEAAAAKGKASKAAAAKAAAAAAEAAEAAEAAAMAKTTEAAAAKAAAAKAAAEAAAAEAAAAEAAKAAAEAAEAAAE